MFGTFQIYYSFFVFQELLDLKKNLGAPKDFLKIKSLSCFTIFKDFLKSSRRKT